MHIARIKPKIGYVVRTTNFEYVGTITNIDYYGLSIKWKIGGVLTTKTYLRNALHKYHYFLYVKKCLNRSSKLI